MILSLHRSHRMAVNLNKPGFATRAFVFDVALGLGRDSLDIDPLSGMLMNLVKVDQILQELGQTWRSKAWSSLTVLLVESQKFLEARIAQVSQADAGAGQVRLEELCLCEKRSYWLKWQQGKILSGREEIRELETKLFKIRYEYSFNEKSFNESSWEHQSLDIIDASDLFSENVFHNNPGLESIEIENLATAEKWNYSA